MRLDMNFELVRDFRLKWVFNVEPPFEKWRFQVGRVGGMASYHAEEKLQGRARYGGHEE
jgi:hypothetical protein